MNLDRGARPNFPRQMPATRAECDALEIARKRATGELPQPRDEWGNGSRNGWRGNRSRSGTGIGTSIVNDGSGHYAQVHWEGPNFKTFCYIRQPSGDPNDIHGHDVKSWNGIPKWEETDLSPFKRIRGREVDIQAPETQVRVIYNDTHIIHQDRFFHHHPDAQHIEQGQPERVQIGIDPTQVHVHRSDNVRVEHHEPRQPAWKAVLFGVKPAKQQAIPQQRQAPPQQHPTLPPPQVVNRGFLLPAPQPQQEQSRPLAIAHLPEVPMPMQAQRKKSRSWL
jgi:hypothetical protein